MNASRHARLLGGAFALWLIGGAAQAQQPAEVAPDARLVAIFSSDNRAMLCGDGGTVRPAVVLGELGTAYSVNFFALPPNPRLGTPSIAERDIPDTVEARTAAWIIEAGNGTARQLGLSDRQHRALIVMRSALVRYLEWASAAHDGHPYRTAQHAFGPSSRPGDVLVAFFQPLLDQSGSTGLAVNCPAAPVRVAGPATPRTPEGSAARAGRSTNPPASLALRGQIDDLMVRPGTEDFKKASSATLAFTDNNEAGTTSLAISGVVGLGANFGRDDALFGFLQYARTNQETDAVGDDDDAKDVHTLSPGLLYRHPFALGHRAVGTLGFVGYATFDLQNDAQLVRARLVASDLAFWLGRGRGYLCGSQRVLLFLYADCRLSAFVEAAEVLDAGRNADLLRNADDEYFGVGGEGSLILSPRGPALLRPLSLRATYRMMGIVSGALDDPERLELVLNYAIPLGNPAGGPGLTFGISRTLGENFETFQHEDLWKLTLGLKF